VKHLWVRLSLAFVLVSSIGIISVALVAAHLETHTPSWKAAVTAFLEEPHGFTEELATSYETTGNWNEAKHLLDERQLHYSEALDAQVHFDLLDSTREHVIYSTTEPPFEKSGGAFFFPVGPKEQPYAILRLDVAGILPISDLHAMAFILPLCFILSVVFGIVVSRTQTRPLAQLAATAYRFRRHELDQRAVVKGSVEVVEVAQAFNAMAEELQQSETLRRNLVADVAHELRTPLTVLQSRLYGMLDDMYPIEKAQIASLYDQTRLLGRLVDDLLELSRAEAHQLALNTQVATLEPMLEETISTFQLVAKDKNITLTAVIADGLPLIPVDVERLNQVIFNLVTNALRHTPSGGTIEVKASSDAAQLHIAVKDSGEGIPPEELPHVFERFYRVDRSRQRASGGTGLGLAIAKSIVDAHNGTLTASSEPGCGAVFTVSLPLSK
jgi:two-component system OmpR family sensor kinase/two-component system sensor histidine kinase BaeS